MVIIQFRHYIFIKRLLNKHGKWPKDILVQDNGH